MHAGRTAAKTQAEQQTAKGPQALLKSPSEFPKRFPFQPFYTLFAFMIRQKHAFYERNTHIIDSIHSLLHVAEKVNKKNDMRLSDVSAPCGKQAWSGKFPAFYAGRQTGNRLQADSRFAG